MHIRCVLATVILVLLGSAAGQEVKQKPVSKPTAPTSEELRSIAFDFVHALSNFYLSTHLDQPSETDVEMSSSMMNDNRRLRDGVSLISKYEIHHDERVRVAAEGTVVGARMVMKSNTDLLAIMRKASSQTTDEIKFQVALWASTQKEGYGVIVMSAPWITGAMFRTREQPDQSGPIAYNVWKADRNAILEEINALFGKELAAEDRGERTDNHNAIVLAAKAIRDNLSGETYEELDERKKKKDALGKHSK